MGKVRHFSTPPPTLVVDTSVFILLGRVGAGSWLQQWAPHVRTTSAVLRELTPNADDESMRYVERLGLRNGLGLSTAAEKRARDFQERMHVVTVGYQPEGANVTFEQMRLHYLAELSRNWGECTVLAAALQRQAVACIDDHEGARVASESDIPCWGTWEFLQHSCERFGRPFEEGFAVVKRIREDGRAPTHPLRHGTLAQFSAPVRVMPSVPGGVELDDFTLS